MDKRNDEETVTELWGCGFNQFGQIDESGDDVHELTRIDSLCSEPRLTQLDGITVLWAGWADFICTLIPTLAQRTDFPSDAWKKDHPINLHFKGLDTPKILKDTLERAKPNIKMVDCFGTESLIGVKNRLREMHVLEGDRKDEKISKIDGYIMVVVAGNGYVAAVPGEDIQDYGKMQSMYDAEFPEETKLEIYSSLSELLSPPEKRQPLLQLEVLDHYGYREDEFDDSDSDPDNRLLKAGTISCLSAGDAHFSFVLNYRWPEHWQADDLIQDYSNIWTIRTDTRSLNDDAWIPLDEELASMDTAPWVSVEGPGKLKLPIFCAAKDDSAEFETCLSVGWITAGVTNDNLAWIFPFGRAFSKVPNLPFGRIDEVPGVEQLALGDGHIVLRTRAHEVWTFGANDHGQRGSEGGDSWKKLDIPEGAKVRQIACGRWNTFVVLKRKQDPENSDLNL